MAKLNYSELTIFEVYEALKYGEIKCFPNGYLDQEDCKLLLRKIMLEEDKLTREEICQLDFRKYLVSKQLGGVSRKFENVYEIISYCFPEMQIEAWELKKVPNEFWQNPQNRLRALLWMTKKENINLDNVNDLEKITAQKLNQYFGSKILKYSNNSMFELLDLYFQGRYKEWQIINKMGTWTDEKVIAATRWLIDEVYGWTRDEVCQNISIDIFIKHGLDSMLSHTCRHSILVVLQLAYPEQKYTKKDIKCTLKDVI